MPSFPTAKIVLFSKVLQDGRRTVMLRVTYERRSKHFSLHRYCRVEEWDAEAARFRRNYPEAKAENDVLRTYEQRAADALRDVERDRAVFSFEAFEEAVFGRTKAGGESLLTYVRSISLALTKEGRLGSASVVDSLARMITLFRSKATFSEVDAPWLRRFEHFLKAERKQKDRTVYNNLTGLRSICRRVVRDRVMAESWYPFAGYSLRHLSRKNIKKAVRSADMRALEQAPLEVGSRKALARDLFLFSFHTRGMNLVDIAALTGDHIQGERLKYTRTKTGKNLSIKLSDPAVAILNRYRSGGRYLFSIYDELTHITDKQKRERLHRVMVWVNQTLRALASELGLSVQNFSFYTARHTYATELKRRGVSVAKISQLLGHASIRVTEEYLKEFEDSELDSADDVLRREEGEMGKG